MSVWCYRVTRVRMAGGGALCPLKQSSTKGVMLARSTSGKGVNRDAYNADSPVRDRLYRIRVACRCVGSPWIPRRPSRQLGGGGGGWISFGWGGLGGVE